MKVLMINSFFSVGGPPRVVKGIYDSLIENGDECLLAAARERQLPEMNTLKIGTSLTVYLAALFSRLFDCEGFCAKNATKRLIKKIKEYDPDIIHLHNLHGYYINVEILFKYLKESKKPVVWTMHDCWPATGHCPHFTMVKCDKWKTGCYSCPLKKDYPASFLIDRSKKNWEEKKKIFNGVPNLTIVCVSKWLEGVIKQSYLSGYDTAVIYNGIDLTPFKPVESDFREKYNIKDKKVLVGVAMHWVRRKGLDDYIKLAKCLDDDTVIVLVGLTDEQAKSMPNNIIGIAATNSDNELAKIYTAADICLNLSYEETFGLTSVEALACGTPIITYDQTAVPEISNMFGMPIVKAGDINALAAIIRQHPKKQDSAQPIKVDLSCFEHKNQYREYLNLYRELLEGRKK